MQKVNKKVSNIFLYLIFFCYACEGVAEQIISCVWPSISADINADISLIGILSIIIYISSGIASLLAHKIRNTLGTNLTTTLTMTFFAISIVIYIFSKNFIGVSVGIFITGLGLGLNDVSADSYVLKAYGTKQDSILHSCWTVGAFIVATILTFTMSKYSSYKLGFVIILFIFIIIILSLFFTKRSWERKKPYLDEKLVEKHSVSEEEKKIDANILKLLAIKNMPAMLICFGIINAISRSITDFISTIMVGQYNSSEIIATSVAGFFCLAGFIGRIFGGFISDKCDLKKVLIFVIFVEALIYIILFLNILDGSALIIIFIVLGMFDSILIPYVFAYTKEIFDTNILSALFGYGNAFGIICSITISGMATLIIQKLSIRYIEIVHVILLGIIFLSLMKIKKERN